MELGDRMRDFNNYEDNSNGIHENINVMPLSNTFKNHPTDPTDVPKTLSKPESQLGLFEQNLLNG